MNWKRVLLLIGLVGGAVASSDCQAFSDYIEGTWTLDQSPFCDVPETDPLYNEPICIEWRREDTCKNPARGVYDTNWCRRYRDNPPLTDAENAPEPDAGTDGDAGESDAGSEPDASSAQGNCVPKQPDYFAAPQPVWFGPKSEAPEKCPDKVGAFGGRNYYALYDPGGDGCPQCACNPIEGVCAPQVTSIHFRGAKCEESEASTIDFSPPENWNGSCSNNHSIAPNTECPSGSGIPCVQSSYASALPEPIQGCTPIEIPVPKLITDAPFWQEVALSCSPDAEDPVDTVTYPHHTCFYRPERWASCVRSTLPGVHACPTEGEYLVQKIVYPEKAIIDHRSCTACECKASGGSCYASFRLYEDDACSKLLTQSFVFSDTATCANVPSGMGVGSKEIADPVYVPGSCEPTGGVPVGDVKIDTTNAVTWCCRVNENVE